MLEQFFIGLTIGGWIIIIGIMIYSLVRATLYLTGLDIIFGRLFSKFTDLIESYRRKL